MPKRLPDPIDAKWWFTRGDNFLYAVRVLSSNINVMAPTLHAIATCAAFCCECYMKVLAQLERNGPPLDGHDLKALAHDLTSKSYQRLKRDWLEDFRQQGIDPNNLPEGAPKDWARMRGDFDGSLEESSKAFVDFRYNEPGKGPMKWSLSTVPYSLRELILELKPEWQPSTGPFVALNPKSGLSKAKNYRPVRAAGWSILDYEPTPLDVQVGRGSNPKNGGTGKSG